MQFLWIKDTETIKIEEILISRVFYILNIRSKIIIKTLLIFVSVFTPLIKCVFVYYVYFPFVLRFWPDTTLKDAS